MDINEIWTLIEKPVFIILAIGLLTGIFYGINFLRTQKQLKLLSEGASWAYGFAERAGQEYLSGANDAGTQKFKKALAALERFAGEHGLKFNADVLAGAIQLAWQRHEGQQKLKSEKGQVQQIVDKAFRETIKPH